MKIINIIVSVLLSFICCGFIVFANSYLSIWEDGILLKKILSFSSRTSIYIIIFMTLGILSGAFSAFIITRYKNYNFIASMILPTLVALGSLYISFILPIYLILTNVEGASLSLVDWGITTFNVHFIIVLFLFLRDQKKLV